MERTQRVNGPLRFRTVGCLNMHCSASTDLGCNKGRAVHLYQVELLISQRKHHLGGTRAAINAPVAALPSKRTSDLW